MPNPVAEKRTGNMSELEMKQMLNVAPIPNLANRIKNTNKRATSFVFF